MTYAAGSFPKLTLLAPLRKVPVMVTELPVKPDAGVNDVIVGGWFWVTVYEPELVTVPVGAVVFVTVIGPLVALAGTTATNLLGRTGLTTVAGTPLNLTVDVGRKSAPVIVTCVPAGPLV